MTVVMMLPEHRARLNNVRTSAAQIRQAVEFMAEYRRDWANKADDMRRIRDESTAFVMDCAAIQLDKAAADLLSVMAQLEMIAADGVRHAKMETMA